MQAVTTIGLDIAKSVFQVHGVDAAEQVVVRRQLKRRYVLAFFEKRPPCLVGIEACASSHHWSRELKAARPSSAGNMLAVWRERATQVTGKALPSGHWLTEEMPEETLPEVERFLGAGRTDCCVATLSWRQG